MSGQAAHTIKVSIATTLGGTYTEITGIDSANLDMMRKILDATDFADTSGATTAIYGLFSGKLDLSGKYVRADTAVGYLRSALLNATTVFVKFLDDGTNGYRGEYLVESFKVDGKVDDTVNVSCSLQLTSSLTAVP